MFNAKACAAASATSPLAPATIARRDPGPTDLQMEILFCGVCHSDLHTARYEWGGTQYPCVPGHEIVGRVVKAGAKATRFKEGDLAAVGCLVDSCRACETGFRPCWRSPPGVATSRPTPARPSSR